MTSWKTTLLGIVTGLALILGEVKDAIDNDPTTVFEVTNVIAGLGALGLGFAARDKKVSDEAAGAKG